MGLNMRCGRVQLVVLVASGFEVHVAVNYLYFDFSTAGGLVHQYMKFVDPPVPIGQRIQALWHAHMFHVRLAPLDHVEGNAVGHKLRSGSVCSGLAYSRVAYMVHSLLDVGGSRSSDMGLGCHNLQI